jgi:hypothetical protein
MSWNCSALACSALELVQRGHQVAVQRLDDGHVNRRRDHVVRRLAHVHVVVRVHQLRADLAAQDLRRAVRDHLVRVHVGRGARAGLEDVDHELVVVLAVGDLAGRLLDRPAHLVVQLAEALVRFRRGELHQPDRPDETPAEAVAADREVQHGALRRRAVQCTRRNFHLPHRIAFAAHL